MTKALTVQQKALTMRSYLEGDKIKGQLAMALPKWLSIDRFIRVAFTAVLKNPKLLDCTPESIASSFVQCASLGLEPVQGRAHLVPYQNNKKSGRPLEMQMQVGYQGFIELARRSGDIRDVKPFVVYENDEFSMEYGDADSIMHKPFMGSEKDRGKPIGGYVKWIFRDDYVSKHYIGIDEIYDKHRAKSQAYNYAISKGKTDTPWIEYEDIMIMKTLVKATARWEPSSVETLQAVEMDDFSDMGQAQPIIPLDPDDPLDLDLEPETGQGEPFEEMIKEAGYKLEDAEAFIAASAKQFDSTVEKVRESALKSKASFLAALKVYVEGSAPQKSLRDEFINLKTKGFAPWVQNLGKDAFLELEDKLQEEIRGKWKGLYEDPFPFDEAPEQDPDPGPGGEGDLFGAPTDDGTGTAREPDAVLDGDGDEVTGIAKYQKDMLMYMETLGQDVFFEDIREVAQTKGEEEGWKDIMAIPEMFRPAVLKKLQESVDLKLAGAFGRGEE